MADLASFLAITCCEDADAASWFVAQGGGDLNRSVELFFTRGGVVPPGASLVPERQWEAGDPIDVATQSGRSVGAVVLEASPDGAKLVVRLLTPRFETKNIAIGAALPPSEGTRMLVALGTGSAAPAGRARAGATDADAKDGDAFASNPARRSAMLDALRGVVAAVERGRTPLFPDSQIEDIVVVIALDHVLRRAEDALRSAGSAPLGGEAEGAPAEDESAEDESAEDAAAVWGADALSLALEALRTIVRKTPQHAPLLRSMPHAVAAAVAVFRRASLLERAVAGHTLGDALELYAEAGG